MNKKYWIGSIAIVLALLVMSAGVSYSYFAITTKYSSEATAEKRTAEVTTDQFDLNFITSQVINSNKMNLILPSEVADKSEKSIFSVSKISGKTYDIKYDLYLTDFNISDNLKSKDFKWDLLENGVSIASGDFRNAVNGENYMFTSTPILLTDSKADYELRIWLEESSENQISLLNGVFGGKVSIDAYTVQRNN